MWKLIWYAGALGLVFLGGTLALSYMTRMPGRSYHGPFEPLSERETAIRDQVRRHIAMLAGTIGERNMFRMEALSAAAEYVKRTFEEMGFSVLEQGFTVQGKTVKNLEVELRGESLPEEIVLFGAHYDSVFGTPGANDNASGVAALLVLARLARERRHARTLRFVAFVNEEPPFFLSWQMGSRVYARRCAERRERIAAMLSLETIGYYSDAAGSQSYPVPFNFSYPNTGNFISLVGNLRSRDLVQRVMATFRKNCRFPSEGVAAPGFIPGIGWSDHWSFWQEGYPAIMVTDTALYRYAQYHSPQDTPAIIDYDRTARVVAGLDRVREELAGRQP